MESQQRIAKQVEETGESCNSLSSKELELKRRIEAQTFDRSLVIAWLHYQESSRSHFSTETNEKMHRFERWKVCCRDQRHIHH